MKKSNKKPKTRPCAQTKKNLKRIDWYYRDGHYFVNKAAYKAWSKNRAEEKAKAQAEKAEAEKTEAAEVTA